MRRGSWDATGLLEPVWKSLGVSDGRDELARRTGIPATNLSSINTGKRRLTLAMAHRISEATGATLEELGDPGEAAQSAAYLVSRLEGLAVHVDEGREAVIAALVSIDDRLSRIERQLGLEEPGATAAEPAGRA